LKPQTQSGGKAGHAIVKRRTAVGVTQEQRLADTSQPVNPNPIAGDPLMRTALSEEQQRESSMFGIANLATNDYYPSDMLSDFKDIEFYCDGTLVSVAVDHYRNNNAAQFPSAAKGGTEDALVIKDALMSLDHGNILARAGGASRYVSVFVGKGSPDAIGDVLTMLYDYSDKFIARFGKSSGPARKCANWLADDDLTWEETMQKITSEFIGLDCNGFVGNWAQKTDHSLKLEPGSPPRGFFDRHKTIRKSVDDITAGDVVVWANFCHIAAIDGEAGGGSPLFNMCQSAGGGPRINEYSIRVSSPGKFRLSGGYPAGDVGGEVYIFSLWQ
jgi:hypothetical protein